MSNLPDDWGAYYRRCSECGHMTHMSGTLECKCVPCETEYCENLEYQDGYCMTCHETKDHVECWSCEERYDPYDMYVDDDEVHTCSECRDCILEELLSSKRVQWKKIHELGYCLHTIMEEAQKDRKYALAEKAASAVYVYYNKGGNT